MIRCQDELGAKPDGVDYVATQFRRPEVVSRRAGDGPTRDPSFAGGSGHIIAVRPRGSGRRRITVDDDHDVRLVQAPSFPASHYRPRCIAPPARRAVEALLLERKIGPGLEYRAHKGLNNRADNSDLPFRTRERSMYGHRSPGGLQRVVPMHSTVRDRFVPAARRRRSAEATRYHRLEAFGVWRDAAGLASQSTMATALPRRSTFSVTASS